MAAPQAPTLSRPLRAAADLLAADLQRVFGPRLHSLVAYAAEGGDPAAAPLHTLALVERLTFQDLAACAPSVERWQRAGLAVPLLLSRDEFRRSLDVFPREYGGIIAHHIPILGDAPFAGAVIAESDLRRACELQAKSHLIHLREGYLEAAGDLPDIVSLIASSAPALRSLLRQIQRLVEGSGAGARTDDEALAQFAERTIGVPATVVRDVFAAARTSSSIADPTAVLSPYIAASERIWEYVDSWKQR